MVVCNKSFERWEHHPIEALSLNLRLEMVGRFELSLHPEYTVHLLEEIRVERFLVVCKEGLRHFVREFSMAGKRLINVERGCGIK